MAAIEKTKNLQRLDIPLHLLEKNERNPNKMSSREFDLLVDNLEKTGITDAILVRPLDVGQFLWAENDHPADELVQSLVDNDIKFRIVGGHHRFDAAAYLGFDAVPCTIIADPDFDEEQEKFQIVRMNAIRGKLDPQAFFDMYQSLAPKYADDVLQEAFGFAEETEFKKLIEQTAKALPDKQMQKKFKEAAEEIKTIDGLSKLLNQMFTKYGDTLPYGYMIVDHGGQRSLWVRTSKKTMDALDVVCDICIDNRRTIDDVLGGVLTLIAKGELPEQLAKIIASAPEVDLPANLEVAPTKDNIAKVASL